MLPWAFGDVVSAAAGGGVDVVGDGGPVTGAGFCFICSRIRLMENVSSILIQTCFCCCCGFCLGAGSSSFITLEFMVGCDDGVGVG